MILYKMGLFWSVEPSPLHESLLIDGGCRLLRSGDLLLVSDSALDESVFGGDAAWSQVAILVPYEGALFAFNGEFVSLDAYIRQWARCVARPLDGARDTHYDKALLYAANRSIGMLARAGAVLPGQRSSFVVARVLHMLEYLDADQLTSVWTPEQFSLPLAPYGPAFNVDGSTLRDPSTLRLK